MGRKTRITGWVLSILIAAFFLFSASGKLFIDFPDKEKKFAELGWSAQSMKTVGVLEIVFAIAFLLPRVGLWGAILLTAYLGGAVCTHMRIGQPWFFPILLGIVMWVALGLRQPAVFKLAMGGEDAATPLDAQARPALRA